MKQRNIALHPARLRREPVPNILAVVIVRDPWNLARTLRNLRSRVRTVLVIDAFAPERHKVARVAAAARCYYLYNPQDIDTAGALNQAAAFALAGGFRRAIAVHENCFWITATWRRQDGIPPPPAAVVRGAAPTVH